MYSKEESGNNGAIKEQVLPDGSIPVMIGDAKGNISSHYLHFHDCLEIDIITGGTGINCIDDKQYNICEGEVYVINNYEKHFAVNQRNLKMKYIVFDMNFLFGRPQDGVEFIKPFFAREKRIIPNGLVWQSILDNCTVIDSETKQKRYGYELYVKAALLNILAGLNRACEECKEISWNKIISYDRIRPSIEKIQRDYAEELSLEQLSKLSYMSKNYFSTYFKNVMGINVSSYIEGIRIYSACAKLLSSSIDITALGLETGYKSQAAFNTAFKKQTGMSPREYRKRYSAE